MASYIPALARVDPDQLGMAVVTMDGRVLTHGAAHVPFSIQSISKVFTLAMALLRRGEQVFQLVGREPSGDPFNSIVQLEHDAGIPRNPFINAGAIAVSQMLLERCSPPEAIEALLGFVRRCADDPSIEIDAEVARSEAETGARNRSLAYFMCDFGTVKRVEETLRLYFHQCALEMSCVQLARVGAFLANDGLSPFTKEKIVPPRMARQMNALMMTCGHYDASGDFAYRVGLPGKSGVGGGILAVVPGEASIAVWSPGLSRQGNSLAGAKALEVLARETGWSAFRPAVRG